MSEAIGSALEVCTAFAVLILGLVVTLQLSRVFRLPAKYSALLYFWHYCFSLFYIYYSKVSLADATEYYYSAKNGEVAGSMGSDNVILIAGILIRSFELSYLGVSTFFGVFGFIGLLAFASALREVSASKALIIQRIGMMLPFLPGLSFWSSALGKDSIAFLAAGLIAWSALNLRSRTIAMVIAVAALLLVRIHIAALLLVAICFPYLVSSQSSLLKRLLLGLVVVPLGFIVVFPIAVSYVGLDQDYLSFAEVESSVEKRQGYNRDGGSSVDISSQAAYLRLFTFLFRPLFIDSPNAMGLLASSENAIVLALFIGFLFLVFRSQSSMRPSGKLLLVVYVALTWFMLANVTANLGIAVRQKTMFLPSLLVLVMSYYPPARRHRVARVSVHAKLANRI